MNKLKPGLYCVSTPIGNMDDFSMRGQETLRNSHFILCEDTRVSKKLLTKYNIKKKLISYHKFNEKKKLPELIDQLNNQKIISIISDAGTPCISDPGGILIKECIKNKINVYPIPGPSAVTSTLSISSFSDKFIFLGFLPEKIGEIKKLFKNIVHLEFSIIFFISPKKIKKITPILEDLFVERDILICREISKIHEQFIRTNIKNLSNTRFPEKGESTVVISEPKIENSYLKELTESDKKNIKLMLNTMSVKDVTKTYYKEKKVSKKLIYNYCLQIKDES